MRGIEWAAGLFVGEGSWGYQKRSPDSLWLSLGMRDEEAVREFAAILDEYMPERITWTHRKKINVTLDRRGMYRIHIGTHLAQAALDAMSPHLTAMKGKW